MGRAKHTRIMPGGALESTAAEDSAVATTSTSTTSSSGKNKSSSIFVGNTLEDHRGAFILDYPMEKGCVVDGCWEYMETIWNVSVLFSSFFTYVYF